MDLRGLSFLFIGHWSQPWCSTHRTTRQGAPPLGWCGSAAAASPWSAERSSRKSSPEKLAAVILPISSNVGAVPVYHPIPTTSGAAVRALAGLATGAI
jgi:hypothetical protein